ncbi:hypothetical protein PoB_006812000 [Plakobranchus ocellatus]|uniref:Uncharacterized protein n=1 Tax=Plakobranchus ocellatus TaxID=259542 RepID=A0AAV4DC43_9GAST|nr:hypothetical protein PoB_006812000 [Plakobranchus ocellatus]
MENNRHVGASSIPQRTSPRLLKIPFLRRDINTAISGKKKKKKKKKEEEEEEEEEEEDKEKKKKNINNEK